MREPTYIAPRRVVVAAAATGAAVAAAAPRVPAIVPDPVALVVAVVLAAVVARAAAHLARALALLLGHHDFDRQVVDLAAVHARDRFLGVAQVAELDERKVFRLLGHVVDRDVDVLDLSVLFERHAKGAARRRRVQVFDQDRRAVLVAARRLAVAVPAGARRRRAPARLVPALPAVEARVAAAAARARARLVLLGALPTLSREVALALACEQGASVTSGQGRQKDRETSCALG